VHERIAKVPKTQPEDPDWSDESDDDRLKLKDRSYVTSSLRITTKKQYIYDHCVKAELPRPSNISSRDYDHQSFVY